jgi:hypothetical protein
MAASTTGISSGEIRALVDIYSKRAGSVSVEMIDRLKQRGLIEETFGAGFRVTHDGKRELAAAKNASRRRRDIE